MDTKDNTHTHEATPSAEAATSGMDTSTAAEQSTAVEENTQAIQSSMDAAAESTDKTFDALAPSATEAGNTAAMTQEKLNFLHELSVNTVYLMGSSFIVGVLFTVFVLLVLDFMRRNAEESEK